MVFGITSHSTLPYEYWWQRSPSNCPPCYIHTHVVLVAAQLTWASYHGEQHNANDYSHHSRSVMRHYQRMTAEECPQHLVVQVSTVLRKYTQLHPQPALGLQRNLDVMCAESPCDGKVGNRYSAV